MKSVMHYGGRSKNEVFIFYALAKKELVSFKKIFFLTYLHLKAEVIGIPDRWITKGDDRPKGKRRRWNWILNTS